MSATFIEEIVNESEDLSGNVASSNGAPIFPRMRKARMTKLQNERDSWHSMGEG